MKQNKSVSTATMLAIFIAGLLAGRKDSPKGPDRSPSRNQRALKGVGKFVAAFIKLPEFAAAIVLVYAIWKSLISAVVISPFALPPNREFPVSEYTLAVLFQDSLTRLNQDIQHSYRNEFQKILEMGEKDPTMAGKIEVDEKLSRGPNYAEPLKVTPSISVIVREGVKADFRTLTHPIEIPHFESEDKFVVEVKGVSFNSLVLFIRGLSGFRSRFLRGDVLFERDQFRLTIHENGTLIAQSDLNPISLDGVKAATHQAAIDCSRSLIPDLYALHLLSRREFDAAKKLLRKKIDTKYSSGLSDWSDDVDKMHAIYFTAIFHQAIYLASSGQREVADELFKSSLIEYPKSDRLVSLHAAYLSIIGNDKDAYAETTAFLKIHPKAKRVLTRNAVLLSAQGDKAGALKKFIEVSKVRPQSPNDFQNLALSYREMKDSDNAIRSARRAVALEPSSADAVSLLAVMLEETLPSEAIIEWKKALSLNASPNYQLALAGLYLKNAQPTLAREILARIEISSGTPLPVIMELAARRVDEGNYKVAESLYQKVLDRNPRYVAAHYSLGNIYWLEGRPSESARALEQAVKWGPQFWPAHLNLGNVLLQSDPKRAIRAYETALKLNPGYSRALLNLGLAYYAVGDSKKSLEYLQSALKAGNSTAHANIAMLYFIQGKFEAAESEYRKAISALPPNGNLFCNLGDTFLARRRPLEAIPYYKKALEIGGDLHLYWRSLGSAYYDSNQFNESVDSMRRAIAIKSDFEETHRILGMAYMRLNRFEEARREFNLALNLNPTPLNQGAIFEAMEYMHKVEARSSSQ